MSEWRTIGVSDENAAITDGSTRADRRVINYPTDTCARPTVDDATAGFPLAYAEETEWTFILGTFAGTVRLAYWDENSERWVEETTTITLPASGANANNQNHMVQRANRGHMRGCVIVETTNSGTFELFIKGRDKRG